jgi:prephenate dehydrogenase
MAYVSHLPQLLAVALMNAAGGAVAREGLTLGARAFQEMTRLAASPADVWRSIASTNADFVDEAVRALIAALPQGRQALDDGAWIDGAFPAAREWRRALDGPGRPV